MDSSCLNSVVPALITPFDDSLGVDYESYTRLVQIVSDTPGVKAIVVNGGAGQDDSLSRYEKSMLIEIATRRCYGKCKVIVAVNESELTPDIGELARDAQDGHADGVMIMPPQNDYQASLEGSKKRFGGVLASTTLPIIFYQTRYDSNAVKALSSIEQVIGMKDGCNSPVEFENNYRMVKANRPAFRYLTTHSKWLLSDLAFGADGVLSGMGSIASDLLVDLFQAVRDEDLTLARKVNEQVYHHTRLCYQGGSTYKVNCHSIMKYVLYKRGTIQSYVVRPSTRSLSDECVKFIDKALKDYPEVLNGVRESMLR